jgi:hypothetical protein
MFATAKAGSVFFTGAELEPGNDQPEDDVYAQEAGNADFRPET